MKSKIITLSVLLLISVFLPFRSMAQLVEGSKSVGVKTGYITLNHTATAGIDLHYAFSHHFVLAPSIDYIFRNEGLDGVMVNLDYHGPWQLDKNGKWYIYHILGLNYASWGEHTMENSGNPGEKDKDVTTRFNRFGLDVGAGVALYVTPTLKLSLQGKFNWIKDHNTGLFNLGISYVF